MQQAGRPQLLHLRDLHGDRAVIGNLRVFGAQTDGVCALWHEGPTALARIVRQQTDRQEVHAWAANESGHKRIDRAVVQLQRRPDLLNPPGAQHDDLVGHGHGLHLIVRHVDHGGF